MSTANSIMPALGSNLDTLVLPSIPRLTHESNLLHLLFHRNKNQHRLSKWWKDLSLLRSNVRKLIIELESIGELQTGKPTSLALVAGNGMTKTQLKKLRKIEKEKKEKANATHVQTGGIRGMDAIVKARERVDARLRLMRRGIIPRTWVAFTGVVATTQFSALGMVLLGVLGRIYEIVGPGSVEEQEAMKVVEENRVWGADAEKGWGGSRDAVYEDKESELFGGEGFDDGGVIISREFVGEEEDEIEGLVTAVERIEVIGTNGREVPSPIDVVEDTRMQNGESRVEAVGQTPTIATSETELRKRKKDMPKKSKETMLPSPSPRPSRSTTTPFILDLDFFSSSSATPAITKPEKRKSKSESIETNTRRPKKKNKNGNAIDDLFKGLI